MTTATTPQAEVNDTAKENLLTRFAKAFYRKVARAAEAVSHFVQRVTHANDLVAPVQDEEDTERSLHLRASQFILGALKLVGSLAASLVKVVVGIIIAVVGIVVGIVMAIVMLVISILLLVSKLVQGVALFMGSPYNYVRDKENSRLQWKLYFSSWTPKVYVAMKQAAQMMRQAQAEAAEREAADLATALDEAIDRHPANGPANPPEPTQSQPSKRRRRHLHVVPNPAVG